MGCRAAVGSCMNNGCHIKIKRGEQAEGRSEEGSGQIGLPLSYKAVLD